MCAVGKSAKATRWSGLVEILRHEAQSGSSMTPDGLSDRFSGMRRRMGVPLLALAPYRNGCVQPVYVEFFGLENRLQPPTKRSITHPDAAGCGHAVLRAEQHSHSNVPRSGGSQRNGFDEPQARLGRPCAPMRGPAAASDRLQGEGEMGDVRNSLCFIRHISGAIGKRVECATGTGFPVHLRSEHRCRSWESLAGASLAARHRWGTFRCIAGVHNVAGRIGTIKRTTIMRTGGGW